MWMCTPTVSVSLSLQYLPISVSSLYPLVCNIYHLSLYHLVSNTYPISLYPLFCNTALPSSFCIPYFAIMHYCPTSVSIVCNTYHSLYPLFCNTELPTCVHISVCNIVLMTCLSIPHYAMVH